MGHGLLIVTTIGAKALAFSIERLAQACDIAMTKDGPDAVKERHAIFVQLRRQIADHGLCGGQSDRCHQTAPCAFCF